MTTDHRLVVSRSQLRVPIALTAVGAVALAVGLAVATQRTWLNLLVDGFYVLSIGVSAIFFIATQRLARSRWWVPIQRIPDQAVVTSDQRPSLVHCVAIVVKPVDLESRHSRRTLFDHEVSAAWTCGAVQADRPSF